MSKLDQHPRVRDAEILAHRYNKQAVIIFHLDNHTIGYSSYGQDTALCRKARKIGDAAYKAIYEMLKQEGLDNVSKQ
jgi:hypothetical protein